MFHFGLSLRCVSSKIFRNMLYQARVSPEIIKSIKGIVKNNIPILLEETRAKIKELTQDSLSITIISDGLKLMGGLMRERRGKEGRKKILYYFSLLFLNRLDS